MIFVDLLEVAPAKSPASTSTVFKPRSCASSAQPAPVAPPPITQTSNAWLLILDSVSSRVLIGSPAPNSGSAGRMLPSGAFSVALRYRKLRDAHSTSFPTRGTLKLAGRHTDEISKNGRKVRLILESHSER